MFGLFASQEKKMRDNAANWLELADKVYHFRRDVLPAPLVGELQSHTIGLRLLLKGRDNAAKLKLAIEALEDVLRRTGGAIYPKTSLVENVEFFLVAAIVILGIRTYFVQPFKIPTNSMWPTYNGMTPEVFPQPADEPGVLAKAFRLVAFGAFPHRLDAPTDGEVLIPIGGAESRGLVHCRIVPGRSWLILPTTVREYTFLIDNERGTESVTVRVPMDFDFDWAVYDGFFNTGDTYRSSKLIAAIQARFQTERQQGEPPVVRTVNGEQLRCVRTGKMVKAGERVFAFDELTGDQLFVDRLSYHFMRPSVGSGFVFRTGNIPEIARTYGDQYYIKRLVGTPGDTLEVKGSTLIRNGSPITGSSAFAANAKREGKYPGYEATGLLSPGSTVHVEPGNFFAMGDNSPNSADGRVWGFVPAMDVVGRPLFVYYPFTRHWGPAR